MAFCLIPMISKVFDLSQPPFPEVRMMLEHHHNMYSFGTFCQSLIVDYNTSGHRYGNPFGLENIGSPDSMNNRFENFSIICNFVARGLFVTTDEVVSWAEVEIIRKLFGKYYNSIPLHERQPMYRGAWLRFPRTTLRELYFSNNELTALFVPRNPDVNVQLSTLTIEFENGEIIIISDENSTSY